VRFWVDAPAMPGDMPGLVAVAAGLAGLEASRGPGPGWRVVRVPFRPVDTALYRPASLRLPVVVSSGSGQARWLEGILPPGWEAAADGALEEGARPALYGTASLGCVPDDDPDPCGTALRMCACGLPALAAASLAVARDLPDGRGLIMHAPGDLAGLARQLLYLAARPCVVSRLSALARSHCTDSRSPEALAGLLRVEVAHMEQPGATEGIILGYDETGRVE
jgi:hypothetical protein